VGVSTGAICDALDQVHHLLLKAQFWHHHDQTLFNRRQLEVLSRLPAPAPDGFEGGINARKYRGLAPVSKATATRDLVEWVAKRCLQRRAGGGRSTSYDIRWTVER